MTSRDTTVGGSACLSRTRAHGSDGSANAVGLSHAAAIYEDDADLYRVAALARSTVQARTALHVAVTGETMRLVLGSWRGPLPNSCFADMTELGRNPARIIAAAHSFRDDHQGEPVSCLWEPAWPMRSPAELAEVARHEALCNLAFRGKPMTIVCLYDATRLAPEVIKNAELTHPFIISGGNWRTSQSYLGTGRCPPVCDEPLPPPADDAESMLFGRSLAPVREFSAVQARAAGLAPARAMDLVLAVSEIAANALGHAKGRGVIRSWCTSQEVLIQLEDGGHITDPLAGRLRRPPETEGGHGLWLVNRVCDLVERRTGPDGTITRLHMRRAGRG